MKPIIYLSDYSHKHDTGEGHPENAARIKVLEDLFAEAPFNQWQHKRAHAASLDQILLAHDEDYVFDLQDKTPDHGLFNLDGDTILSPHSYDAALHAAGAACQAVDDILNQETKKAFCSTRPPGHHAEPNTALGFCLFNNIFVAARHAQETHNIKRIAIIDYDVHHGNGTETMTRRHNAAHPDKSMLYISTHAHPLFPMTGLEADNSETLLNIHLPEGCDSTIFHQLYEDRVFPVLHDFKPNLLLLSSGFDAHIDDPLAPINLETTDYAWLTRHLCDIADKYADGHVISILEGGYHLDALKSSVRAHLEELGA
jgi:acetoin utilization deacetylase AcuC-like enzyme